MSLLDVGCGPGTITADLATRVSSIVGIDPSEPVIAEARRDFPDLDLRVGDVMDHEGTYDVVHVHQVLHHVPDPVAVLRTLATLARELIAVRESDYGAFTWYPADPMLDRWLEVFVAVMRKNGAEASAGRRLLAWAHAAGLTDVTYTWSSWAFATPEERAWWGGMWADRCTDSSFAHQAVEYGVATADELRAIADGWRAWTEHTDGVFIVPSGELLARP
jgi:SAM-dependent methyltransferase